MNTTPAWVLALIYWLHMGATVLWVGGLTSLAFVIFPAANQSINPADNAKFLGIVQKRLQTLGWLCLIVLIGTGMFQMSANPNYGGFLAIKNQWAIAIFLKHMVFGVMVLLSAYVTWGITPAMQKLALRQMVGETIDEKLSSLKKREILILRLNLAIALIILGLTALARAS